jgi:hypothetical protein
MSDDTEVREIENERADAVRAMMNQWRDGKLTDAQDTFNDMMNQRADELVANRKQEVATNMFSQIDLPEPTAGEVEFETPEVPETAEAEEPEAEVETETEDEAV